MTNKKKCPSALKWADHTAMVSKPAGAEMLTTDRRQGVLLSPASFSNNALEKRLTFIFRTAAR